MNYLKTIVGSKIWDMIQAIKSWIAAELSHLSKISVSPQLSYNNFIIYYEEYPTIHVMLSGCILRINFIGQSSQFIDLNDSMALEKLRDITIHFMEKELHNQLRKLREN